MSTSPPKDELLAEVLDKDNIFHRKRLIIKYVCY